MIIAVWIIAVCEIIRMLQNALQLLMVKKDTSSRDNAYAEFVKSLKATDKELVQDKEFVHKMLEEFKKQEGN